jgi:aryl-alcohol dehydrogenase-like predicted oxidoreductase
MITRRLWDWGEVPALGLGTWAIGGPWTAGGEPAGWGLVDDAESIRAIHAGVEAGVRFFDTAQAYGAGHAERVLGQALAGRPEVRIATKVGLAIDPVRRELIGADLPGIAAAIDGSLYRLRRDRIDLVLLHLNSLPVAEAEPVFDTLDRLRAAGKVAAYGWSTDYPDRAAAFAGRSGFVAVEHALNVFFRADALLPVVAGRGLLSISRSPLAMGLLGGGYGAGHRFGADDIRSRTADWMDYFKGGTVAPDIAARLAAVRDLVQSGGRTLAQGAMSWIWGRSAATLPVPGFRSGAQVADLAGALEKGPLPPDVMAAIEAVIDRPPEGPPRDR